MVQMANMIGRQSSLALEDMSSGEQARWDEAAKEVVRESCSEDGDSGDEQSATKTDDEDPTKGSEQVPQIETAQFNKATKGIASSKRSTVKDFTANLMTQGQHTEQTAATWAGKDSPLQSIPATPTKLNGQSPPMQVSVS